MRADCCILVGISGLLLKLKAEKISTCFLECTEETTPTKCQVSSFSSYNAEVRSLAFVKSYSALKFLSITVFAFRAETSFQTMNKCRPSNLWVCKRYVTVCGGGCLDAAAILFLLLKKKNPIIPVYFSALYGSFPQLDETVFFLMKNLIPEARARHPCL